MKELIVKKNFGIFKQNFAGVLFTNLDIFT